MLKWTVIMGPNYYVTPAPKNNVPSKQMILLGGGLLAAIFIGIVLLFGSGGKSISSQLQHLSLRLLTLQKVLDDGSTTRNIKNKDLSLVVTDFSLNLQSDTNQLRPLMTSEGLPTEFDATIVANEADTSTTALLEKAVLNDNLDETYQKILLTKIISLRALINETAGLTKNKALYNQFVTTDKNLSNMQKRIEAITP